MIKSFLLLVLAATFAHGATNINIDFGTVGTPPPASYAGAGAAGTWNNVTALGSTPIGGFVDTGGNSIPLLNLSSSRTLFTVTEPFSGPDAPLLGDLLVSAQNDFTLTFSGLANGS